jgi:hypothetical protein
MSRDTWYLQRRITLSQEMVMIPKSNPSQNTSSITSQRNKWVNTDPRTYRRWDQVPGRSKHPLLTCHTHNKPAVSWSWIRSYLMLKSVCQVWFHYWYEKCQTTNGSMKDCNHRLDHCNGHVTCETLTSNETVEIPVTSTCLSVVYPDSKTDRM